jgi:hypothetical protein
MSDAAASAIDERDGQDVADYDGTTAAIPAYPGGIIEVARRPDRRR